MFSDTTERMERSNLLAVAGRLASLAVAPLVVAAIIGGLTILREHDRALIRLEARTLDIVENRQSIRELMTRQTATEAAAAGVSQRLDAQREQLRRIERLLERIAQPGDPHD